MLKVLQAFNAIVAQVQFLQTFESIEVFDFSDTVRLQREDFEAFQAVEILGVIASINDTAISETLPLASKSYSFPAKAPPD
jgi:hypothetical protein